MLNVGLTGNIAAGKSTVVELFKKWGATVIDADALAREAQAPGSAVLAAIAGRFGADVLAPDGTLDRAGLRAKVIGDDTALTALNAIVHRYSDAGMRVEHVTVKALPKALRARAPLSIVATAAAADGARAAWEGAVPPRPCRLYHLSPDPDPVAVRLDLRPWGYDRVALSEEDGAGLAPRADLL